MFSADKVHLILGGPGCGKTTRLLSLVEAELASGTRSTEIAFVTFTKAAAVVAQTRAAAKFNLDAKRDLPWFRTIHSLAYACLGLSHDDLMQPRDWRAFSGLVRESVKGTYETDTPIMGGPKDNGDLLLRITDYASTTNQSLEAAWHELGDPVDWFRLKRFADSLARYKAEIGKMDFTDMLHVYVAHNSPLTNIRVAFIDEAQDLTPAQWAMVLHAFRNTERIFIGGDDDQAIYRWAGADVEAFLGIRGHIEVLPVSHRLPRAIFRLANGISRQIRHRFPKRFQPSERGGYIQYHRHLDGINLAEGTWLLLARNGYMLSDLERVVEQSGVNYRTRTRTAVDPEHVRFIQLWERVRRRDVAFTADEARGLSRLLGLGSVAPLTESKQYQKADFPAWPWQKIWHEAFAEIPLRTRDYYISCLRRGENIRVEPRITIETIHGVKGAEADHVIMLTDMSARTFEGFRTAPDHEHRVFYVGVTRAKQSLHIITPQSDRSYPV